MPSILVLGATGLAGSHLILKLRDHYPKLPVTVLVRNTTIDEYLTTTAGVARVEHGDFSQLAKIEALAEEHDIVINVGSSGDDAVTLAIMEGLKKRPVDAKSVLIHMSGTGNFLNTEWNDGAHHPGSKVWSDDSPEDMKLINAAMFQGGPAALVLTLNKTHPHIATYVLFPSMIFGESTGPVRSLGVIQDLIYKKAKELGFVPYTGRGTAVANLVHVDAFISFLPKVIDLALDASAPRGSQYERTFAIGSPPIAWKDAAEAFAKAYHAKGIIESPEPRSVSIAEGGEGPVAYLMSQEMLFVSPRAEKLGYKYDQPSLQEYVAKGGDLATF